MDFETLKRRRCGLKDRAICLCRDLGTFMRERYQDAHDAMEVIIVDDEEGRNDMLKWIDFESEVPLNLLR
ncbi:Uridylate kinase [Trichinella pseudospiralis]